MFVIKYFICRRVSCVKSKLLGKRSLYGLSIIILLTIVFSVSINIFAVKPYINTKNNAISQEFSENQSEHKKSNGDFEYRIVHMETSEECAMLTKYKGKEKSIKVPSYIDGHPVKLIDSGCFSYCSEIVSIEIPESILSLGDFAFAGCVSLEKVTIHSPTMEIGAYINIDSPLVIIAPDDSKAQQYSADNNIKFYTLE